MTQEDHMGSLIGLAEACSLSMSSVSELLLRMLVTGVAWPVLIAADMIAAESTKDPKFHRLQQFGHVRVSSTCIQLVLRLSFAGSRYVQRQPPQTNSDSLFVSVKHDSMCAVQLESICPNLCSPESIYCFFHGFQCLPRSLTVAAHDNLRQPAFLMQHSCCLLQQHIQLFRYQYAIWLVQKYVSSHIGQVWHV